MRAALTLTLALLCGHAFAQTAPITPPAPPACYPLWGGSGTDLGYGTTQHGSWVAWRCSGQWQLILAPTVVPQAEAWSMLIFHLHSPARADQLWRDLVTRSINDPALAEQLAAARVYMATVK